MLTNEVQEVVAMTVDSLRKCGGGSMIGECLSETIRGWLVAIGSVLVVFVAVFQAWIKGLLKAKLSYEMTNASPHFIVEECGDVIGKLWLEVYNVSKLLDAENVRVTIEEIRIRNKADDFGGYGTALKIHPRHLLWSAREGSEGVSLHISAQSSEYALLLEIICRQATTQNPPDQDPPNQSSIPEFAIVSKSQRFPIVGDFQDVIVRLRVTGTTVRSQKVYLQIAWQGKNDKHLKECADNYLSCKKITEKEYRHLVGEGK